MSAEPSGCRRFVLGEIYCPLEAVICDLMAEVWALGALRGDADNATSTLLPSLNKPSALKQPLGWGGGCVWIWVPRVVGAVLGVGCY